MLWDRGLADPITSQYLSITVHYRHNDQALLAGKEFWLYSTNSLYYVTPISKLHSTSSMTKLILLFPLLSCLAVQRQFLLVSRTPGPGPLSQFFRTCFLAIRSKYVLLVEQELKSTSSKQKCLVICFNSLLTINIFVVPSQFDT